MNSQSMAITKMPSAFAEIACRIAFAVTVGSALPSMSLFSQPKVFAASPAPFAGAVAVAICHERGVESVLVTEEEIGHAFRFLYERAKLACEPAGAVGAAALLAGKIDLEPRAPVGVVVSGGNVDPQTASGIMALR